MDRKASSLILPLTLGLIFSTPFIGCQQSGGTSNGGTGGASGGSSSGGAGSGGTSSGGAGSGGTTARGGSGGTSNGGAGSGGTSSGGAGSGGTSSGGAGSGGTSSGGAGSGGTSSGGSGGTSSGGAGSGGTSAGGAGSGGTSAGGTSAGGAGSGGTSAGGSGTGGAATGGTTGTSTAGGDMISDFENTPGKADMIKSGGRTGYWYVYFPGSSSSTTPPSGTTMTPALVNGGPISSESSDGGNALHVKGSGLTGDTNNYAGTGANFTPHDPYDKKSDAYDVSAYTGITFKVKSGGGTLPPAFFELLTKENQPTSSGGNLTPNDDGNSPDRSIGLYNTRGWMLASPWQPAAISTTWQQVTIPFGYLIPRHLTDSATCTSTASATAKCLAPGFVAKDVLGIQISFYATENGWPTISGATPGTFDIWIDDVAFTKDDTGIQTISGFPLANPGSMGSCKLPQGPSAYAKYLVPAYNMWKKTFVSGDHVIRPENGNDTVSEGIAYGMLIAVSMNDKDLFDKLYSYWKGHDAGGNLMTWCIPAGSGSCSASGGSATDADEDAAYALLQADKVFGGGSYKSDAMAMIGQIWSKDIDSGSKLPTGGSNYSTTSGQVTNPSYFAPAWYAAFKAAGDSNDWDGVIAAVYRVLNTDLAGTNANGLYAAWCSNDCKSIGSNGDNNDKFYQYDSHRIPMRVGLDYCFNNRSEAKTYVAKTTKFFATNANAGLNGVGRIFDMYDPATSNAAAASPTPQNNSASIIGTAAVGAMADGSQQTFTNDAYQFVFDLITRTTLSTDTKDTSKKTPYSYYNATVGMLTALMLTGGFSHQ